MVVDIDKIRAEKLRRSTKKPDISFEELSKATDMHRDDVKRVMYELARQLREIADSHDYTKKTNEEEYYEAYTNAKNNGTDFHNSDWYKDHVVKERHHIDKHVADDINLLDVLEAICDNCCDEMSENGKVGKMEIDEKVLMKSFDDTVELVKSFIRLDD